MVARWHSQAITAAVAALVFFSSSRLPLPAGGAQPPHDQQSEDQQSDDQRPLNFNDHIRPILSDRCYFCHGPDDKHRESGLRLDQREGATEDLGGGAAIQPGDPEASLLIERVLETDEDMLMPPPHSKKDRLNEQEVALLRRWIAEGAEFAPHWAFAPLRGDSPPDVRQGGLASNPIDRFVLARLERAGIAPSPPADRATLIRRVFLDLTGLLPEPDQVAAFESDRRPDAYERLVDSLLASPHFAERWGRHWLDQARYADSNGYSIDSQRSMWPYRDWVIRAIGEDMPFHQFTLEQLAGDLLPGATKPQRIASAFHRNTLINQEGGSDPEQFRHESVVDRVNTTGAVWLGLTLGCAQCHTHKFDPITHREYYELFAFFNSGTDVNSTGATVTVKRGEALGFPEPPSEQHRRQQQRQRETQLLESVSDQPPDPELTKALRRSPEKRSAADQKRVIDALREAFPAEADRFHTPEQANVMVMADRPEPRPTYVSIRGDFLRPDEDLGPLHPGGLSFLSPPLPAAATRNRIDLANWLVDEENPLTPRVRINRVWMRYFGRGLVETEEDFGAQGTPPTHPELLDWLAQYFQSHDTSMKSLHRLIVTSSTYRQASKHRPDLAELDPRNELLARQNRIRVEAEIVRDAALSASGRLDRSIGGPSVHPPQPDGVYSFTQNKKNWVADTGGDRFRRAMYTEFFRSAPHPLFTTFDAPDFQTVCTRRARSNTPLQALMVANDEAFIELARGMAQRVIRELPTASTADRIDYAFRLALSRAPEDAELAILIAFHDSLTESFDPESDAEVAALLGSNGSVQPGSRQSPTTPDANGTGSADAAAMVALCRTIFNIDNFITRE